MNRYCIVKYYHYEAQKSIKKKHYLKCKECPLRDKCEVKE